jgi:hypothetical protein
MQMSHPMTIPQMTDGQFVEKKTVMGIPKMSEKK